MTKAGALKEKENEQKMKALRRELDDQIQDQLETAQLGPETSGAKVQIEALNEELLQDPEKARQVIEALVFAASKPITINEIKRAVKGLTPGDIKKHIEIIKEKFDESGRSYELVEVAGGYEIATKKEFAPWIMKIELQKKARQASQSALETLAILAYRQPLTRAEIEELRGVDSSGVLGTMMERGFVKIVGKKEVPGRPFIYGTTDKFLEHFGLATIGDLPSIEEIRLLVEKTVKKEDLLKSEKIVAVEEEDKENAEEPQEPAEPEEELSAGLMDEITDKINSVSTKLDLSALEPKKNEEETEETGEAQSEPR